MDVRLLRVKYFVNPLSRMLLPRLFSQFVATNTNRYGSLLYTKNHEWIQILDKSVLLGLTNYALEKLGDLLFIEVPKPGDMVRNNGSCINNIFSPDRLYRKC